MWYFAIFSKTSVDCLTTPGSFLIALQQAKQNSVAHVLSSSDLTTTSPCNDLDFLCASSFRSPQACRIMSHILLPALIGLVMSCGIGRPTHLIGTRPSYRHAPILSERAHLIGARPPILSARAQLSCQHAPISLVSTRPPTRCTIVCKLLSPIPLSSNRLRTRRICATISRLTVRLPLLLAMSHCPRCRQEVTRITANTCDACKDLLCRGCNGKHVKSEGKQQCEQCIERDRKRREKGRVIRRMCIENPSLRRAYCTKCKRVKETDRFRRLLRADPDGNEYERSCLSCLKKLNPTAVAPLGAPTATHEASHAPLIEHDPNSASPQRPVSQEECSSSYQDIEEISTAGSTENNTDGSSNAARWTLGDALRLDYTSRISQLTNEILEVVEAPSRTSEKFG